MKYGTRLRELIKERGLSQSDLADKIGMSRSAVSFWMNSEYPPLDGIEKVCAVLEMPVYKFFMTDKDMEEITGVDLKWIDFLKAIKVLPEDIQVKIWSNIDQILEVVELALVQHEKDPGDKSH